MNDLIFYFTEKPYRIFFVTIPLVIAFSYFGRIAYYHRTEKNIQRYRVVCMVCAIILLLMSVFALIHVYC